MVYFTASRGCTLLAAFCVVWVGTRLQSSPVPIGSETTSATGGGGSSLRASNNNNNNILPHLFAVVGSNRTGAEWLLAHLNADQDVCVPVYADILDPEQPTYQRLQEVPACTFAFVRDGIQQLTNYVAGTTGPVSKQSTTVATTTSKTLPRCAKHYEFMDDPLAEHLLVLCRWIDRLNGDYSDDAILQMWLHAYQTDAAHLLEPQCRCSAPIKGLKVAAEWLPRYPFEPWNPRHVNLNATILSGGKVVYMKRTNWLARFMSRQVMDAEINGTRRVTSLSAEDMLGEFPWMEHFDRTGLAWVHDHAKQLLVVDYEACRADVTHCLQQVRQFLDLPPHHSNKLQTMLHHQKSTQGHYSDATGLLKNVDNANEVKEALLANNYSQFLANAQVEQSNYHEVHMLVYEKDPMISRTRRFAGLRSKLFGPNHRASGILDSKNLQSQPHPKFAAAMEQLRSLPPNTLVVLGDSDRDVMSNNQYSALATFKQFFNDRLSRDEHQIIVSASSVCCAAALSHVSPKTGLFAPSGGKGYPRRTGQLTCSEDECLLVVDDDLNGRMWKQSQQMLAAQRGHIDASHAFLDAGLMAGRAADLLRVLEIADIKESEDATAVLTDLMRLLPELIALDYEQELFGMYRENPVGVAKGPSFFSSMVEPLVLQHQMPFGVSSAYAVKLPQYPVWGPEGIEIGPILDHIQRVADETAKLSGIDTTFSPEVPYFIDQNGLWVSNLIRSRTSESTLQWRTGKIEENIENGIRLIKEADDAAVRWPALYRALQNGGVPFFAFFGDFQKCNYKNYEVSDSIPVFTESATVGCDYAFPTPTYQAVFDARVDRYRGMFRDYKRQFPLESKIRKVVWRGSLSTNDPDHMYESIRWRLLKEVHESGQNDLYDIGFTKIPNHNHRANDRLDEVGGLAGYISPMSNFMNYLAVLDMDGASWSSRFGSLLCYNSVVIKVEPEYIDYFHYDLKPWTHYVPVKGDLSDLHETVSWVLNPANIAIVGDIIESANQWCAGRFNPDQLANDRIDIWESYVRRLDQANPKWSEQWQRKKGEVIKSKQLDFVRL